jgi:hypothetical protein
MDCEAWLEKHAPDGVFADGKRRVAFAARVRRIEQLKAARWLAAHPSYHAAEVAFVRELGGAGAERFELLAAVAYAMDKFHAEHPGCGAYASPKVRAAAMTAAAELGTLVGDLGARHESPEDDVALLRSLERYIAHNRRVLRGKGNGRAPYIGFGKDVAHLLLLEFGRAPASVVKPLLRLVGYDADDREIAALAAAVKREARALRPRERSKRKRTYVLDRIAIAPTKKAKRASTSR